jgi:hypothetical protein
MAGSRRASSSHRKGKIARSEWPRIAARHANGESHAAIARDYGCSAPNIRYIVKGQKKKKKKKKKTGFAEPVQRSALRRQLDTALRGKVFSELGHRATSELASLIIALDGASAGSRDALSRLHDATVSAMLCLARMLIEIERLERAAGSVEKGAPDV